MLQNNRKKIDKLIGFHFNNKKKKNCNPNVVMSVFVKSEPMI